MEKRDYKKEFSEFYRAGGRPQRVVVPAFHFLSIEGAGSTEGPAFQQAVETLFTVSYQAKFLVRQRSGLDFGVMPLEGLWWADDPEDFLRMNKDRWQWRLLIMQPEPVDAGVIAEARDQAAKKIGPDRLARLRYESWEEGQAMQILHVGPFADERPAIQQAHRAIEEAGGTFDMLTHRHHEVYLSDFRKTAPERLKTLIRQPYA